MRRLLITGATGFIGGHLLRALPPDVEVIALGRQRPGSDLPVAGWIEHDLAQSLPESRLPGQLDAIVHLAQSQVYREFPQRAAEIFDVNVRGTFQLVEYARRIGVGRFVFASSGGVYKFSPGAIPETGSIEPAGFYVSTKYAAELLLRNYEQFFPVVVLRLFFVYGPGQQPGMLVPTFTRKIFNHEPIAVDGNPGLRINPIFVADAVRAIVAALEFPESGIFNVAGDDVVTISELVALIQQVAGLQTDIEHLPTKRQGDLVADTTRMREILGVRPRISLADGLRETVQSFPVAGMHGAGIVDSGEEQESP